MKNIFTFLLFLFGYNFSYAQKTYIQVNGESNLSVFLDSEFKGKTTLEYNGYIIENVNAGSHIIKIVKEGFTPYEETITVKTGEVFSYKVKPFAKHAVTISQQGNSAVTNKKVELQTGKLVLQSVPIEIKVTIPQIEGVSNSEKNKDEWIVNEIPEGSYELQLTYGNKTLKKTVDIIGGEDTRVFANMLNGEFTVTKSLDEKSEKERQVRYTIDFLEKNGFKRGLTLSQFFEFNPDAARLNKYKEQANSWDLPKNIALKDPSFTPGPRYIYVSTKSGSPKVWSYHYALKQFNNYDEAITLMKKLAADYKQNVPLALPYEETDVSIGYAIRGPKLDIIIVKYKVYSIGKSIHEVTLCISAD